MAEEWSGFCLSQREWRHPHVSVFQMTEHCSGSLLTTVIFAAKRVDQTKMLIGLKDNTTFVLFHVPLWELWTVLECVSDITALFKESAVSSFNRMSHRDVNLLFCLLKRHSLVVNLNWLCQCWCSPVMVPWTHSCYPLRVTKYIHTPVSVSRE